eukprot:gnl/TRDRNA2_/TRDRNA2_39280_c0_seq1.p1 gnl/TRDRNA2_/TRDRNA2_39280_c0~~gnl/TRDRNA2_/TRDRNA2_39280_c0_seq1.p1  ORF type:complete len:156 (+),score=34.25 gnl/TRDRNA2_/TRDRNA2_39280_c0_seq1:76-543(+)
MSSIQEALSRDYRKDKPQGGRGGKNPLVLSHKQEYCTNKGPLEDFTERIQVEHQERKAARIAEGGRAGGYNDRQPEIEQRPDLTKATGIDDFGRRMKDKPKPTDSKAERRNAALERLRAKARGGGGETESGGGDTAGTAKSGNSDRGRDRSRSRG